MTDRDKIAEIIRNARMFADPLSQVGYAEADALLANGVIVPPCKVGDTIYRIFRGEIRPIKVDSIDITKFGMFVYGYSLKFIGKTVFLTKEEAEKALKERKENELQNM